MASSLVCSSTQYWVRIGNSSRARPCRRTSATERDCIQAAPVKKKHVGDVKESPSKVNIMNTKCPYIYLDGI